MRRGDLGERGTRRCLRDRHLTVRRRDRAIRRAACRRWGRQCDYRHRNATAATIAMHAKFFTFARRKLTSLRQDPLHSRHGRWTHRECGAAKREVRRNHSRPKHLRAVVSLAGHHESSGWTDLIRGDCSPCPVELDAIIKIFGQLRARVRDGLARNRGCS